MTDTYRVSGWISLEGQENGDAQYDFEMESDSYPNEMDVFDYMVNTGIIQIIHENTEFLGDDE